MAQHLTEIPKHTGYFLNKEGELYSNKRGQLKKLKPTKDAYGYYTIKINGKTKRVHALMLETFVGERQDNYEVCHNDGNRINNRLDNLRYGTRKENMNDRKLHGVDIVGEKVHTSKLKNEDVIRIRKLYKEGFTQKDLSNSFNVGQSVISRIVNNKAWSHLT